MKPDPGATKTSPPFLNQVLETETDLTPNALLGYLKSIEKKMGRKPTFRLWSARHRPGHPFL